MPSVKLTITRVENNECLVVVSGEGFLNAQANARVGVRIKGDDQWFDETLFPFNVGFPGQVLRDGTFTVSATVPKAKLNEDWGQDEIYALAKVDGFSELKSNVVKGYY